MDIIISTRFQWGLLFNGKINWPMECKVYIKNKQVIIYVNLISDKETSLDLLSLLNKAFKTNLPENLLQVNKAGFFSYINNSKEIVDDATLREIFSECNIPENIGLEIKSEKGPTCLWCCMSIKKLKIFDQLIEIGIEEYENDLEMMAILYRKDAVHNLDEFDKILNECLFFTKIPSIRLLGLFNFNDLALYIKLSQKNEYFLKGNIILELFNDNFNSNKIKLICDGEVNVIDGESLHGEFDVRVNNSKDNIIQISQMSNLKFGEMIFSVEHIFGKNTFYNIKGIAFYGDKELEGKIYFDKNNIKFVDVELVGNIAISDIFKNSIQDKEYPNNLFDFVLEDGSKLYYCLEEQEQYKKGFNIFAKIAFILRTYTLEIQGNLNINTENKEINGEILLNNDTIIDLYLIQFKAIDNDRNSQPRIIFSNKNKLDIVLYTGLCFLGEACGKIGIGCYKDEKNNLKISGNFSAPKSFNKFLGISADKDVSLSFTYSKMSGFSFTNWPSFYFFDESIDFIKELKKYMNSSGLNCKKIGKFLYETDFNIEFNFIPKIEHNDKEDKVFLILNGKCIFRMKSDVITDIDIDNLIKIEIPINLTLGNLRKILVDTIKDNLLSIVKWLKNNEDKWIQILAIIGGAEIVKEITNLLCRKVISPKNRRILEKAGEAVSAVSMGASVGTSGVEFGGELAIGAGLAVIETLSMGGSTAIVEKPESPKILKAEINDKKIDISWSKVNGATGYLLFILNEKTDNKLYEKKLEDSINKISIDYYENNKENLIVNILTINKFVYSEKSTCKIINYANIYQPQNVKVNIMKSNKIELNISWDKVENISDYIISIRDNNLKEVYNKKLNTMFTIIVVPISWGYGDFILNVASVLEDTIKDYSDDVKFNLDLNSLALRGKYNNLTAIECGNLLYKADNMIDCKNLVTILKNIDYNYIDIAVTIGKIWINLTNEEILDVMLEVYGRPLSRKEIIVESYNEKKNGQECANEILRNYKNVSSKEIGILMKEVGYNKNEIRNAIKVIRPFIEDNELESLLEEIFK